MLGFLKKIFADEGQKKLKTYEPIVDKVNALKEWAEGLSAEEIRAKTAFWRDGLQKGEIAEADILPEAFALVREAAKRTLGQFHFDVQLIGGIALHEGNIAEMKTGEGKTLVATLPAYLNALSGKGVHIVTVNDYLSRRDAVWMGQVYDYLGLSVGVLNHESSFLYDTAVRKQDSEAGKTHTGEKSGKAENAKNALDAKRDEVGSFKVVHEFLRPCGRQEAYKADITYGTNNEFGFDYLRDNLEYDPVRLRQREFNYAVVDEIDSILIDEARTPLIISAPTSDSEDFYGKFSKIAEKLNEGEDYAVDEKLRAITLKDAGIEKAEKILGVGNIYTEGGIKYVHHLETAVRAKALFKKDKEYVVREGEVVIVDEFTGRLQPGRRWSEGLHQAVEAKEGVRVQKESRTFASITFQNYFRMYKKLSGMTGTALTSAEEFFKVYGLEVIVIPTNRPMARKDRDDLIFQTEHGKFLSVARSVKEANRRGQPVLIGTVSIEDNERLSEYLKREGVPHVVLNAKNHEREGEIIAQAGKEGAVTIATNMAGRGVDIKLGGNPATKEAYEKIKELGGLLVIGTERHEARRIDNQLRGRSGRQGDPGETQFYVSMEDSLMRVFATDIVKKMMGRLGVPEDEAIHNPIISRSLETAQKKIEGFNFDSRKHILSYDDVLNKQRQSVYIKRRKILLGKTKEAIDYLYELLGDDEEKKARVSAKLQEVGEEKFGEALRMLILQTMDMFWVDHLELMEYARGSVNLRAFGQRDPLVEYKNEGLRLFKEMNDGVREQILSMLFNPVSNGVSIAQAKETKQKLEETREQAEEIGSVTEKKPSTRAGEDKVGRNDPCPCGSGKKYKKCHGA